MASNVDYNGQKALGIDRGFRALELRKTGMTYAQIAQELGGTQVSVFNLVKRRLAKIQQKTSELAEAVVQIELQRLDQMLEKLNPKIEKGDTMAIAVALKIQERRSKYLGLDAPEKSVILIGTRPEELTNAILDDLEEERIIDVPTVYKGESVN